MKIREFDEFDEFDEFAMLAPEKFWIPKKLGRKIFEKPGFSGGHQISIELATR